MRFGGVVENQVMVRSSTSKQLQFDLAVDEADNMSNPLVQGVKVERTRPNDL